VNNLHNPYTPFTIVYKNIQKQKIYNESYYHNWRIYLSEKKKQNGGVYFNHCISQFTSTYVKNKLLCWSISVLQSISEPCKHSCRYFVVFFVYLLACLNVYRFCCFNLFFYHCLQVRCFIVIWRSWNKTNWNELKILQGAGLINDFIQIDGQTIMISFKYINRNTVDTKKTTILEEILPESDIIIN